MSRMGLEINKLRNAKGMTEKQLGKLIGVSESFVMDIESGKRVLNGDLAARIAKVLGRQDDSIDLYDTDEPAVVNKPAKTIVKSIPQPVQQIWNDALGGVLKTVPVFDYKMTKELGTRQLPIVSNKVEGLPKDKVFYLKIEEEDMIGFRISKGDLALAFTTQEIEKDAVYFIEYNGQRAVRQIKSIGSDQLLLVSNRGSLITETISKKGIKVLARLVRLEIIL